jgi:hypothetical protein
MIDASVQVVAFRGRSKKSTEVIHGWVAGFTPNNPTHGLKGLGCSLLIDCRPSSVARPPSQLRLRSPGGEQDDWQTGRLNLPAFRRCCPFRGQPRAMPLITCPHAGRLPSGDMTLLSLLKRSPG